MAQVSRTCLDPLAGAAPGSSYAVVDDEPVRLREPTDLTTDALGTPRVGAAPPALVSLFLERTLVSGLVTSFRIDGSHKRRELGWAPGRPSFRGAVAETVAALS